MVVENQAAMVQAEAVEQRGVEIVNTDTVFHGVIAEFVGCSMNRAALDTTSGHPHREAVRPVVATRLACLLRQRQSAEFSTPDQQGRGEVKHFFF